MLTTATTTATVAAAAVAVGMMAVLGVVSARKRRKKPIKLTKENVQHFMRQIDAVVCDCDGKATYLHYIKKQTNSDAYFCFACCFLRCHLVRWAGWHSPFEGGN